LQLLSPAVETTLRVEPLVSIVVGEAPRPT
jgi:hypothetical protein